MKRSLLLAACILVAACDPAPPSLFGASTRLPTEPTDTPPPPPPDAPEVVTGDTPSASVLVLSDLKAEPPAGSGFLQYSVHFTLTETSGASGAWIRSVDVVPDTGSSEQDCVAWPPFRIEPGAIWFSWRLSYCLPYGLSRTPASRLTLTITYTDDEGHPGTVEGKIQLIP